VLVGTCRAVNPGLALGDLLLVDEAIGADGVSRELGDGANLTPDPALEASVEEVAEAAGLRPVTVASVDLLGELDGRPAEDWAQRGAAAVEMTTAALLAAGPRCGVAVAALLAVSDVGEEEIGDEELNEASTRIGRLAVAALSSSR
jgi:uridine phosphorylase